MMNYFNNEDQADDAYSYETEEATRSSQTRVGMYIAFMSFMLKSALASLLSGLAYVWRRPVLPSLMFVAFGGVLALAVGWMQLPTIPVDMPEKVQAAADDLPDANGAQEEIVNPEIAALERGEILESEQEALLPEIKEPLVADFAPVDFLVAGEFEVGAPITFSVPEEIPGRQYELNLGNGIKKLMTSSLTYAYPAEGVFLVVLVAQEGEQVYSSTQVLEIAAASADEAELAENSLSEVEQEQPEVAIPASVSPETQTDNLQLASNRVGVSDTEKSIDPVSRSLDATPAIVSNVPEVSMNRTKPLSFSEVPPAFPGGERTMISFLNEQIRYPKLAKENEIGGKVYTQFVVQPDGSITGAKVVRGIGYGCDEEALRIIRMMPKWTPGLQAGQAVPVIYTLPVNFDFSRY